jgi:hypothetical protein
MANEKTTGAPLTARLGEQLEEKERLETEHAAERAAGEVVERRVERKKAEERDAAIRHATPGAEEPLSAADAARRVRRAGRAGREATARRGGTRWQLLLGGLAVFAALFVIGRIARR